MAKPLPDFDYNVSVTQEVVAMAHKLGITVEGELGCLGSLETMKGDKEDGHGTDATMTREQLLTDPEEAAQTLSKPRNSTPWRLPLAPATALTSSPVKPTGDILAIDRIKAIHQAHSQHPFGDARLEQRAARLAGQDQPVWRRR